MQRIHSPSSAVEEMTGQEFADSLYLSKLEEANNVGDVRYGIAALLVQTGSDGAVGERMKEIKTSVEDATENGAHDSVLLKEDLGNGVEGVHTFASGKAEVVKSKFSPKQLVEQTRNTLAVIVEEDEVGVGHPGQDPAARVNVIVDGQQQETEAVLEGNVGKNIQEEYGITRDDAPEAIYKEGERLVEKLGTAEVDEYVRKGGKHAGEHMQALVWKKATDITYGQMLEEGKAVGMTFEEIQKAARDLGKAPKTSNQFVHAA